MLHLPVMLEQVLRELLVREGGVYLDCTFGRGGHSTRILERLGAEGRLLALDRDLGAVRSDQAQALQRDTRFELMHSCFSGLEQVVEAKGWVGKVAGVLMDLGVSSPQLDDPDRGFSFMKDGPLDMRMDESAEMNAAQWLAQSTEREIVRVLFEYGEERFARRIAAAIVKQRIEQAIVTTRQLAELIETVVPVREKHKHPATRSFQAIRIAVNQELEELKEALQQSIRVLRPGGRLVVISFHSLEDRVVKRLIRDESRGQYKPGKLPVPEGGGLPLRLRRIGKAHRPSRKEITMNPRARSAVMRVAEKI